jgi:hypothetical protein
VEDVHQWTVLIQQITPPKKFNEFHFWVTPHFFYPYALANVVLLSPIWLGQRAGALFFKIKTSIFG